MTNQTRTIALFPSVVLRSRLDDHQALAEALSPEIEQIRAATPNGPSPNWACPLYSTLMTDDRLHRRPPFNRLIDELTSEILALAEHKAVDLETERLFIDRCWLNVLGRGQSLDVHTHANSFYTGIYFLQAPPEGARLFLYSPTRDMGFSMPVTKETQFNQEAFAVQPETGELIIFDSLLSHSFQVHAADQEHINLSFTARSAVSDQC